MIDALTNWQINTIQRKRAYGGNLLLLAWDLVGSVLAYANWDILVRLLTGEMVTDEHPFTCSLYRSIMNDDRLHQTGLMRSHKR